MKVLPKSGLIAIALGAALLGAAAGLIGQGAFDNHASPCRIYTAGYTPGGQYNGSVCTERKNEIRGLFLFFTK